LENKNGNTREREVKRESIMHFFTMNASCTIEVIKMLLRFERTSFWCLVSTFNENPFFFRVESKEAHRISIN
jgi:hypothetical protein